MRQGSSRQANEPDSHPPANSISAAIERIAGNSVTQIERLIAELTQIRDYLDSEAEAAACG